MPEAESPTSLATSNGSSAVARGNYAAVRYNAMTHGILSRLTVLPHEDAEEYGGLLTALITEHRPMGMTERHLVEELASIIWRKQRVLLAEGAAINRGLHSVVRDPFTSPVDAAAPFERGLTEGIEDLGSLLKDSPQDAAAHLHAAELDVASARKATAILRKAGTDAYARARRALTPDSRAWWDECVEREDYPATAEGLEQFIRDVLEPICIRLEREARYQPAIKAQTLGEGIQAERFDKLSRYETHLDRKFERTLAMLLKLKELRNG